MHVGGEIPTPTKKIGPAAPLTKKIEGYLPPCGELAAARELTLRTGGRTHNDRT